jgi:hypothetical protein
MGPPVDREVDNSYCLNMNKDQVSLTTDQISTLAVRLHVDLRRQASAACSGGVYAGVWAAAGHLVAAGPR